MVKVLIQITAEVLNSMVPPQRDNEHVEKCCYQALQDKFEDNLLNQVFHGAAKVSMVKMKLQITAEVLNCVVLPQRDDEQIDKFEMNMVVPVLQSMAEVNMMKLAHDMTTEVIV